MSDEFRVGDTVRLKSCKETAVIEARIGDIEGGVVLNRYLKKRGSGQHWRCWNVADLVKVKS